MCIPMINSLECLFTELNLIALKQSIAWRGGSCAVCSSDGLKPPNLSALPVTSNYPCLRMQ